MPSSGPHPTAASFCRAYLAAVDWPCVAATEPSIIVTLSTRPAPSPQTQLDDAARLVARSLKRAVLRRELWNGNRERIRNLFKTEPEENIVLWGWVKHPEYRERYSALLETEWRDLEVHRLRTATEVDEFRLIHSPR